MAEHSKNNPYAAPAADLREDASAVEQVLRRARKRIGRTSWFAIISGSAVLIMTLITPHLVRWLLLQNEGQHSSPAEIDILLEEFLQRVGYAPLKAGTVAGIMLFAGVLVRFRPKIGLLLLLVTCAALICHALYILSVGASGRPIAFWLRIVWLMLLIVSAYRTRRALL